MISMQIDLAMCIKEIAMESGNKKEIISPNKDKISLRPDRIKADNLSNKHNKDSGNN
jgi:hypothetical protein